MDNFAILLHGMIKPATHLDSSSQDRPHGYFRYLPPHPEARTWGTYVTTAGFSLIPPGSPYPPQDHPLGYHFTWDTGRTLTSLVMIYLTRGRGEFETAASGLHTVGSGDVLILLPGQWHRYRPDPATGWDEYWIECDGPRLRHLLSLRPLNPDRPVLHLGPDEAVQDLFLQAIELLRHEPPDFPFLLGATAELLLARLFSALKRREPEIRRTSDIIRKACVWLTRDTTQRQDLHRLAAQLNLSYSTFRRLFRTHTGFSPRQYVLEFHLRRASDLLTQTTRPISRIADELGFESVFYFSRFFKQRTGVSPLAFRKQHPAPPAGR